MNDVVFLSVTSPNSVGVRKKIENQVNSCERLGVNARWFSFDKGVLIPFFEIYKSVLSKRFDVLILRHFGARTIFIVPLLFWLRMRKVEVILDVPTPYRVILQEIRKSNLNIFVRYLKPPLLHILVPIINLPASTVLQYSDESRWFSVFASGKTKPVANGYDFDTMDERPAVPEFSNELRIICVASIAFWHGYDRLINGLNEYRRTTKSDIQVKITIAGDGRDKQSLVDLVQKLSLNDAVEFVGNKSGDELQKLYNSHHIGVSSLGSFRINLYRSSTLKNREYACVGLPFIIATEDPDFPFDSPFVFQVPQDESFINIGSVIDFYSNIATDSLSHSIRHDARQRISYDAKIRELLNLR